MSFGRYSQALREAAALSRTDLARRVGVPASTLRDWKGDRGMPGLPVLLRLAEALGVPVERFAEGGKTRPGRRRNRLQRHLDGPGNGEAQQRRPRCETTNSQKPVSRPPSATAAGSARLFWMSRCSPRRPLRGHQLPAFTAGTVQRVSGHASSVSHGLGCPLGFGFWRCCLRHYWISSNSTSKISSALGGISGSEP
jgi:transcriptional regulator with XRE-family HTH domain